jgi:hypothetical protein
MGEVRLALEYITAGEDHHRENNTRLLSLANMFVPSHDILRQAMCCERKLPDVLLG